MKVIYEIIYFNLEEMLLSALLSMEETMITSNAFECYLNDEDLDRDILEVILNNKSTRKKLNNILCKRYGGMAAGHRIKDMKKCRFRWNNQELEFIRKLITNSKSFVSEQNCIELME